MNKTFNEAAIKAAEVQMRLVLLGTGALALDGKRDGAERAALIASIRKMS